MKTIFEKSIRGRIGFTFDNINQVPLKINEKYLRKTDNNLPEASELDVVRHYTLLSKLNFNIDSHFYPLGSCTMKYNPKINETTANLGGFINSHPFLAYLDEESVQGSLEIIYNLSELLSEITGMSKITTQPYAGAHGELTGILIMAAYHKSKKNNKKYIIIPDSAHGTNPASAAAAGYEIISIPVNENGCIDFPALKNNINSQTAGIMMTVPSTLGVFETEICEIIELANKFDALMYFDGANLNALLGKLRPGDIGFDIIHINLHKTFSTPHGGGGPGSGVIGVSEKLADFIPHPEVCKKNDKFYLNFDIKNSIGQIASFFGNFSVLVKAYTYILTLGKEGLINISEMAVLNANYILNKLKDYYKIAIDKKCMHECVFSVKNFKEYGLHATDFAKALIDKGIHPPTVYFPLVVEEALMIEPTETESKQTLDIFIEAMIDIAKNAKKNPESLKQAPITTIINRPDEAKAARELKIKY